MSKIPELIFMREEEVYPFAEPERWHLGASQIDIICERALWYTFRKCTKDKPSGRMIRLFRRGKNEELSIFRALRSIGIDTDQFDPSTGKPYRFSAVSGFFQGEADAMCKIPLSVLTDDEAALVSRMIPCGQTYVRAVLEIKTCADKYFDQLTRGGVEVVFEQYFGQMQIYMRKFGKTAALFVAVNKNTDEIYCELVPHNQTHSKMLTEKAGRVIYAETPPPKIGVATYYKCQLCRHHALCHMDEIPAVSCRTCVDCSIEKGAGDGAKSGFFKCNLEKPPRLMNMNETGAGCDRHRFIPELLPWLKRLSENDMPFSSSAFSSSAFGVQTGNGIGYEFQDFDGVNIKTFTNGGEPGEIKSKTLAEFAYRVLFGAEGPK